MYSTQLATLLRTHPRIPTTSPERTSENHRNACKASEGVLYTLGDKVCTNTSSTHLRQTRSASLWRRGREGGGKRITCKKFGVGELFRSLGEIRKTNAWRWGIISSQSVNTVRKNDDKTGCGGVASTFNAWSERTVSLHLNNNYKEVFPYSSNIHINLQTSKFLDTYFLGHF